MQLTFCTQDCRGFKLPTVSLGKNDGDVTDLVLKSPALMKRKIISVVEEESQVTSDVRAHLSDFAPERGQIRTLILVRILRRSMHKCLLVWRGHHLIHLILCVYSSLTLRSIRRQPFNHEEVDSSRYIEPQ